MFASLSIRGKLLLGFLFVAIVPTIAGYIGVASTQQVGRLFGEIVTDDVRRNRALVEMKGVASEIASQTISFGLVGNETAQAEGTVAADKKFRLLASIERMQKWEGEYRRHMAGAARGEAEFLQQVSRARELIVSLAIELIDLKEQGRSGQALRDKEQQLRAAQVSLQRVIDRTLAIESATLEERWRAAEQTATKATQATIVISLSAILLAFLFAGITAGVISTRITELQATAVQIAQGHLDRRVSVTSSDEIGRLGTTFNDMANQVQNLIEIVHRAKDESERAKQEAERASQAKSDFLSRMSHELRTPLNAILGFGQLLQMDSLPPEQHDAVEHILKAGRHLLDLINEVLDISRIEAGRLTLSLEPVLVDEIMQETVDLAKPLAAQQEVRLTCTAHGPAGRYVLADRQRLKQVLLNLLANGVKYNHTGGAVTLASEEVTAGRLRIKVTDTGPGIPPDRREGLFIAFERLGAERSAVEGTGLGLALSKRLVEAMGGILGVESTVGQGSTFWLELAIAAGPLEQVQRTEAVLPIPTDLTPSQRARLVLYIEDNLSNMQLVQRLLVHRPEVRVLPAMQGRMGLDLARQHHPHLILLDLHLPDIAGDEVLRRLREDPETAQIPVVMISADATARQVERLLAAGARDYLTKPLDVKRLLELFDEILRRHDRHDRVHA